MMKEQPHSKRSVIGIIFNRDRSEILLIKRRDVSIWVLPGGGIEADESPQTAMTREFFEETGLTVSIKRQIAYYTPINRLSFPTYFYECQAIEGQLQIGNETQDLHFFSLDNLPNPLFFLHKDWIDDARLFSEHLISKPLSQITYFNLLKYFLSHPFQVFRLLLSRCGLPINSQSPMERK